MRDYIKRYLETYFDEITPTEFYRGIFPKGDLEEKEKYETGKYNAIAVELIEKKDKSDGVKILRHLITDDLNRIEHLQKSENFIIISPITYVGKSRCAENARYLYALAIDFDGITEEHYLRDLFYQIESEFLPKPTYIVFSGSGLHLYYVFQQPIPCYHNIVVQLSILKQALTRKIWNVYTTSLSNKPQLESLFQGFRMVGGITKDGSRTKAFSIGEKITIEYLNNFVLEEYQVKSIKYKGKLTLQEAQKKYPEWYENRILNKRPRGSWTCKRALYDWWHRRIMFEATEGHRYYSVMILAVMAKKSGISREELEKDAFNIVNHMDKLTSAEDNHFTKADVLAALEMYNDDYITFPIDSIVALTNIPIKKNKRNGRNQKLHLKIARANKAILKEAGELKREGRPPKDKEVIEWQRLNPKGNKAQCIRETGISRATVSKYWKKI